MLKTLYLLQDWHFYFFSNLSGIFKRIQKPSKYIILLYQIYNLLFF